MEKKSLSGTEKFAYGIGAVGKDMMYMFCASYVLYYFQDVSKRLYLMQTKRR